MFWLKRFLGSEDEIHNYFGGNRLWSMHLPFCTHILRFESLGDDLNNVLAIRGLEPVELPFDNTSKGRNNKHYRDVYDKETKMYIANRFAEEIAELGYNW